MRARPAVNVPMQVLKELQLLLEADIGADPVGGAHVSDGLLALQALLVHEVCAHHGCRAAAPGRAVHQDAACRPRTHLALGAMRKAGLQPDS